MGINDTQTLIPAKQNQVLPLSTDSSLTVNISENTGKQLMTDSISQSSAIAAQDITEYMRQIQTVSMTAIAVCTEMLIATKDTTYSTLITDISGNLAKVAADVSTAATSIAQAFSSLEK